MKTYDLYWSPTGQKIATVDAETGQAARRKAPQPYRKYLGEIYSVPVKDSRFPGISINATERFYVIESGNGFSCLGFDVCENRASALEKEMNIPARSLPLGTFEHYARYAELIEEAKKRNAATGFRSASELTPQLIGLEGRRVEVIDKGGEKRRFQVDKSTGWIPCHLEISRRNASGGPAVTGAPFQSVRVIR